MTHRTISWNTPYTFSGKEKDVETGYGYFGARYYDSGLSIWLSVDPMSDKYPSMSPYNYCANNPVKLIDPNGMEIDEAATKKDPPHKNWLVDSQKKTSDVKTPYADPQSSQQGNTTSQSGNTSNNSNTSSTTSNSNSQNNSSQNQTKYIPNKINVDPNVSEVVSLVTELSKKANNPLCRAARIGYAFDFANTWDNAVDIYNGNANFNTYWSIGMTGLGNAGPVGKAAAVSIDSYKRGGEWLKNYLIEFESYLQQQYNPINW